MKGRYSMFNDMAIKAAQLTAILQTGTKKSVQVYKDAHKQFKPVYEKVSEAKYAQSQQDIAAKVAEIKAKYGIE